MRVRPSYGCGVEGVMDGGGGGCERLRLPHRRGESGDRLRGWLSETCPIAAAFSAGRESSCMDAGCTLLAGTLSRTD